MTFIQATQSYNGSLVTIRRQSWEKGQFIKAPIQTIQFSKNDGSPHIFTPEDLQANDWEVFRG